ncbi:hypothetical protein CMUS01_11241 [Colletotrichum musicola]|uniref:Uncharacterized protein n=1 Tax=Colletotrichum musicola TaxID=2175873 RepID=A0A8H6N6J8_9PEZI|nr:hypothetical protein CMUS01_11241 [Colletotrichum musicola]
MMLHRLLAQDLAGSKNIAHGLQELGDCIRVPNIRLKKSEVIRELREKSVHARTCLVKISEFAEKARDGSGAHKAFNECIVQPCRSLLGMQHDDPREIRDIDEETGHMIDTISYCYANCNEDKVLELVDKLIESRGLLYISRLRLLIRRLEGLMFDDDETFDFESDLEALWTKAWGEPYVEGFANIWSEK